MRFRTQLLMKWNSRLIEANGCAVGTATVLTGIDLNAWVWVIGSERMKADKEHRIPPSDAALAVPEKMERSTKLISWADLKGSDYPT
ncbi:hypothetical protein [Nitrosospira sp. Nsp2]|uniref:hypothetical protein n=1 Tax=Nitrosospira sp. Nsp2 TaxID=136548 RepID=UPI0015E6E741|nr:hypothetical protein [Nitrosospira sp. Nsp2]